MAQNNNNSQISHDARSNFGVKGWWIIIFSFLNWYFYGGIVNSSMNTVVPQLAEKLGVESGNLLSLSTPASLISLVVCLFVGKLVEKFGVKLINGLLLICGAIAVVAWGSSNTVVAYTISLICVVCFLNAVQLVGGNMTVTNWFPKKKGIAIGWATMGLNVSSATFVTILTALTAVFGGIDKALYCAAGALVVLAIINFVFFKNYPEEWGAFPDNNPDEIKRETKTLHTGWTTAKVLKQKESWFMGLANGFYGMVTVGFVSTLITTLISKGFTQPQALTMMTISSLLGLPGSYICGFLDQKFGAKKSSIIYGIWVMVGIIFFFIPGTAAVWIHCIMIGLSLGGSNNYPPSMTAQIFGRDGSVVAFPIIFFIKGLLCATPYLILGQSLSLTGSYTAGWIIFLVLIAVAIVLFACTDLTPKKDPIEETEAAA